MGFSRLCCTFLTSAIHINCKRSGTLENLLTDEKQQDVSRQTKLTLGPDCSGQAVWESAANRLKKTKQLLGAEDRRLSCCVTRPVILLAWHLVSGWDLMFQSKLLPSARLLSTLQWKGIVFSHRMMIEISAL